MKRLVLLALLGGVVAAAPAHALQLEGYGGGSPFNCELQQAGTGTDIPHPDADPLCVEYDKTNQNVTDLGIADFLSQEPGRFALAGGKCFYLQHDHWRGSIEQDVEQTETYNWDGWYFFDLARGVGGAYVENFTFNNMSGDPTAFPFFPEEWKPYFGYGRGGAQVTDSVPIDPRCVQKARDGDVYADPPPGPPPGASRQGTARPRCRDRARGRRAHTRHSKRCSTRSARRRAAR